MSRWRCKRSGRSVRYGLNDRQLGCILTFLTVGILLGSCSQPQKITKRTQTSELVYTPASLMIDVGIVRQAREADVLQTVFSGVNEIYQQCQISVSFDTQNIDIPENDIIDRDRRINLVEQNKDDFPTVFYVAGTAEADVAYAYLPSFDSPLASSIWVTDRVNEACLAWITAHEIGHVLLDSATHSNGSRNVMSTGCKIGNWSNSFTKPRWTAVQCAALHQSPFVSTLDPTSSLLSETVYSRF